MAGCRVPLDLGLGLRRGVSAGAEAGCVAAR
jgi:hypothetical protein